jgi:ferric iron reductase protein FhuF
MEDLTFKDVVGDALEVMAQSIIFSLMAKLRSALITPPLLVAALMFGSEACASRISL